MVFMKYCTFSKFLNTYRDQFIMQRIRHFTGAPQSLTITSEIKGGYLTNGVYKIRKYDEAFWYKEKENHLRII